MIQKLILLITSLMLIFSALAQEEKKQMNAIKKNAEYIYGIGKGDTQDDALELARLELTEKVKTFVTEDPMLRETSAYIISNFQSKTQTIAFEDISYSIFVSCLYINKNDILPLFQDKSKNDAVVITNEKQEQTAPKDEEKKEELTVVETPKEEEQVTPIDSIVEVVVKTTETINAEFTTTEEKQLLSPILLLDSFKEVAAYLQRVPNYKVEYEAVRRYDKNIKAFWAVFDQQRKLVAFLDKTRTIDYLNKKNVEQSTFNNNPQIWIQVVEE